MSGETEPFDPDSTDYGRTLESCVELLNELAPERLAPVKSPKPRWATFRDLAASVLLAGLARRDERGRRGRVFELIFPGSADDFDDVESGDYEKIAQRGAMLDAIAEARFRVLAGEFFVFLARTLDLAHRLLLDRCIVSDTPSGSVERIWNEIRLVTIPARVSDSLVWILYFGLAAFESDYEPDVWGRLSKYGTLQPLRNVGNSVHARLLWGYEIWATFDDLVGDTDLPRALGDVVRSGSASGKYIQDLVARETIALPVLRDVKHDLARLSALEDELESLGKSCRFHASEHYQQLERVVSQYSSTRRPLDAGTELGGGGSHKRRRMYVAP